MATTNSDFFPGNSRMKISAGVYPCTPLVTTPMSDLPQEFDLKFLPDWLKESPATNRYADYQGESADRPRRDRDDRGGPRGPRPERRGPPAPRRDGDRRGPGSGPRSDRPPGNRPGGPRPGG